MIYALFYSCTGVTKSVAILRQVISLNCEEAILDVAEVML
jgi:hypothetical protein